MAKYDLPDLPKELYNIIDEYNNPTDRTLFYLLNNPFSKFDLKDTKSLELMGEYLGYPTTSRDLIILYSMDPTNNLLLRVLSPYSLTQNLIDTINVPELTDKEIAYKLSQAIKIRYYPIIRNLVLNFSHLTLIRDIIEKSYKEIIEEAIHFHDLEFLLLIKEINIEAIL